MVLVLFVLTGLLGAGIAPVYANIMIWLEQVTPLKNKVFSQLTMIFQMVNVKGLIAGLLVVSGYAGLATGSMTIGQFIVATPQSLMYAGLGISLFCLSITGIVALVRRTWFSGRGVSKD